jgi:HlyD family secretion protein
MKRIPWVLALLVIAGAAAFFLLRVRSAEGPKAIRLSGNIEVTEAEVSFKIPGRVEKRVVSEGEMVRAAQLVARLDDTELMQEVALRRAEVQAARAALAELEAGSRPEEIAEAEASVRRAQAWLDELLAGSRPQEVAAAEAAAQFARAEADRLKVEVERDASLYKRELIAAREYDAARTAHKMAEEKLREAEEGSKLVKEGPRKEQIEQARAALMKEKERFALVKKGPRHETIDQARARLQQTKETLALAKTRLGYATLASPLSGIVLSENVEPGEYVSAGTPIVTVGDLEHVWLRAYLNETDLGRVRLGDSVRVTTDTYPGKVYEGRLSFIASEAEFTPKNIQTEKERVKLVYRVKVTLHNPVMELKPGMPADAEIRLAGR